MLFIKVISIIFEKSKSYYKMKKIVSTCLLTFIVCSLFSQKQVNTFYQYNTWSAFVNKVFKGDVTVKDLKKKGNVALGSYDLLDGELIMVDNVAYRVREDGTVTVANNSDTIIYADAAFFNADSPIFQTSNGVDFDGMRAKINEKLPSSNYFYAIKVTGQFESIKCGGLRKQSPPFEEGLDVLIPARPIFNGENISGTMIGFYCPEMIGNINVAGYHFHFISDDKTLGGHVMEFKSKGGLTIQLDRLHQYEFRLPQTADYDSVRLNKEFQYKKN